MSSNMERVSGLLEIFFYFCALPYFASFLYDYSQARANLAKGLLADALVFGIIVVFVVATILDSGNGAA